MRFLSKGQMSQEKNKAVEKSECRDRGVIDLSSDPLARPLFPRFQLWSQLENGTATFRTTRSATLGRCAEQIALGIPDEAAEEKHAVCATGEIVEYSFLAGRTDLVNHPTALGRLILALSGSTVGSGAIDIAIAVQYGTCHGLVAIGRALEAVKNFLLATWVDFEDDPAA